MLMTKQTQKRTNSFSSFIVAASALVAVALGARCVLSNQKQEQEVARTVPKQRSRVTILPLTDGLTNPFTKQSELIRAKVALTVIGRSLTEPPPYTITLKPNQIPKIEHPLDAYSCLIEARARMRDAVDTAENFDQEEFLRQRGCPSLGELLLLIQAHPTDEGFDALRRIVAERDRYFGPIVNIPITGGISYIYCRKALDYRDMLNGPSALLTAAQLAVDYPEAKEILMEATHMDPEAIEMLKIRIGRTPPTDGKDWDMRSRLIDILDASLERMAQRMGLPEFGISDMRSMSEKEAEELMNGDMKPWFQVEFEREMNDGTKSCEDLGIVNY